MKFHDFIISNFDIFRQENDVTKLAPIANFAFSIMDVLWRFLKDLVTSLKTEEKLKYVYPLKKYNVLTLKCDHLLKPVEQ